MFDGFMSTLIEDLMRTPCTREEMAYRRRFYGLDAPSEPEEPQRIRKTKPRILRRRTVTPS